MSELTQEPKRTIIVVYRDARGNQHTTVRPVYFAKGFGHYVKWFRHNLLVGPTDTVVTTDKPMPLC